MMEPVEIKLAIWQELVRSTAKQVRTPEEFKPLALEAAKVARSTYDELRRVTVEPGK